MAYETVDIRYYGRCGLVRAKQALGLSRRGDKSFFVERLSRLLKSELVSRRCKIMALGKSDGAGSQALGAMSAINFAQAHRITYVHKPFAKIEHAEAGFQDWEAAWEQYFNLGEGELSASTCDAPVVSIEDFVSSERLWREDVIVAAEHFLHYVNVEPKSWLSARPLIRAKYHGYEQRDCDAPLVVAAHVRRGDVSPDCRRTSRSYTPDRAFIQCLTRVKEYLETAGRSFTMEVHSQGSPRLFRDYTQLGCALRLDEPAMETHARLVNADIFVMSQSAFSYTVGLLNRGKVLYELQKYAPLPDWIVRDRKGAFVVEKLRP